MERQNSCRHIYMMKRRLDLKKTLVWPVVHRHLVRDSVIWLAYNTVSVFLQLYIHVMYMT